MFTTPQLYYELIKKTDRRLTEDNYFGCLDIKDKSADTQMLCKTRYIAELGWRRNRRPYYKVYPKILEALCRVNLDLPVSSINYPVDTLMILLPEGQTLICDRDGPLTGLMVMLLKSPKDTVFGILPYKKVTQLPYFATGQLTRFGDKDSTFETALSTPMTPEHDIERHKTAILETGKWTRLAVALSLLAKDTGLIIPDVIRGDEDHPRAVERAIRRGKLGWHVGRDIEVSPHVRVPHLCNQPCGPGSKNRKLIWREGSVIHKNKITSIPTGFES